MTNQSVGTTMKCPTCNCEHHAKTDVFGNPSKSVAKKYDFDAREIFGITATCPICLYECSDVVALPCGHVLCKADYQKMGGFVKNGIQNQDDEESTGSVLIRLRKAGQPGVNGTYSRHHGERNKYSKIGSYNGESVDYYIELRVVDGQKMWYLSCNTGNPSEPPVDFYKAQVNEQCAYPARVRWEAASLHGTFPSPKVSDSYFSL